MSKNELLQNNVNFGEVEIDDAIESCGSSYEMSPDTTIRIAKEQYSIFEFTRHINKGRVDISPDFQRFNAWTVLQRSELIESILMGIPIPMLYLFENELGQKQVIDGKQRLTAMCEFVDNKFSLTGLKMLSQFNNFYFQNLPPILQAKIEDCQIQTYIVQPPTPEVVKFYIFERINRGGTQLNQQEMRHALHQGHSTELLINIADDYSFRFLGLGISNNDRMQKEYLALRYLTFYLCANNYFTIPSGLDDLNELHSLVMKFINDCDREFSLFLTEQAHNTFREIYNTLHEYAFRYPYIENKILTSLFEIISFVFTKKSVLSVLPEKNSDIIDILHKHKKKIVAMNDIYGEYRTVNALWHRINLAEIIIKEIEIA
ncbi:DUF262 domain-containing protein [Vibrio splendidus]